MADYNSDRTGSNIDLTLDKVDALVDSGNNVTADRLTVDKNYVFQGANYHFKLGENSGDSYLGSFGNGHFSATGYYYGSNQYQLTGGSTNLTGYAATSDFTIFAEDGLTADSLATSKARLRIDGATGDVSFFEDTGTTAKMVWDASAEELQISSNLGVTLGSSDGSGTLPYLGFGSHWDGAKLRAQGSSYFGYALAGDRVGNKVSLQRYDSAGAVSGNITLAGNNVGIGTASPSAKLDVVGDINVSGGVYLGGTGAANKLDDYEEGTFTPYFSSDAGGEWGGKTTNSGTYVKIGNVVHFTGEVTYTSKASGAGSTLRIRNLPFTASPTNIGVPEVGFANVIPDSGNYKIRISATDLIFYSSGTIQGTPLIAEMPSSGTYQFNFSIVV